MTEPPWPAASLLGRLGEKTRAALLSAGAEVRYPKDHYLLRQDELGDVVYLIIDGVVMVYVETENGAMSVLGIRLAGDMVGELGAIEPGARRSATVRASTPLAVRSLSRARLRALMTQHPDLAIEVSRMIGNRLRWANRRRVDATIKGAKVKLSRLLVEAAAQYGERVGDRWELPIPLTQHELGYMAGLGNRTVEKALADLEADGVISKAYRRISIVDLGKLRGIAGWNENPPPCVVP
ncbi:Crp/Fnr family transcriptional regulator [Actinokineospora sp. NBRC 105648]|uniref:Crp/Fnr family transcriptional regulator n=1 Tax=Actinokineospora sp. NBRC 105648 TaxID=3032206 RepID=UPI0024A553B0|nr:Crp/Fnr family transcriptional regulator [Actinokineospora sp. NBRC 105648]GLZ38353.1 Crp/Fnr family transcriptional regulator [Actinokineospora sp. NBRC 105648]